MYIYIHIYTRAHANTYMCVGVRARMYVCMYVFMYVYMCVYTYIQVHAQYVIYNQKTNPKNIFKVQICVCGVCVMWVFRCACV